MTLFQIAVLSIIPLMFYLIQSETNGFFRYIGLYKPTLKSIYYASIITIFYLFFWFITLLNNSAIYELIHNPATMAGQIKQLGFGIESIVVLLIVAVFQTSFSEEIFFRGFLGKRLINRFGFKFGNSLQAIIFSLIHVFLLKIIVPEQSAGVFVFIFLIVGIIGYLLGWVKEEIGNGSIIPGWISHALGNTFAFSVIAFVLE